jgi:hypothetical protein
MDKKEMMWERFSIQNGDQPMVEQLSSTQHFRPDSQFCQNVVEE